MNIDSIQNGFVIDHIPAGKAMQTYEMLGLDALDCPVAIIKNATSSKMSRKDIIKIDADIDINLNVIGFISSDITVNVIKNGERIEKKHIPLPEKLDDIIKCKNPRCITTTEQGIHHIFKLTDRDSRTYRCIYCDTRATEK